MHFAVPKDQNNRVGNFFLLFCAMTNKCTIISQIITLLHVSTPSCHPQGACNKYLAKLQQVFQMQLLVIRGSADKSLARTGRKQATATKLGIYSTYSPRSSIHFLARCCDFFKPLKNIQNVGRSTRSTRQQCPPRRTKNDDLSIVFSVQGTGGSPTGPDPENRVCDQDIGSPGRPVSSGLQVPGETGRCRARTRPRW